MCCQMVYIYPLNNSGGVYLAVFLFQPFITIPYHYMDVTYIAITLTSCITIQKYDWTQSSPVPLSKVRKTKEIDPKIGKMA